MENKYRGYRITALGTFSLLKIQPPGSGDVPKDLSGLYTSHAQAKMAIDRSLDSKKTGRGRKKNGTEASTSTD